MSSIDYLNLGCGHWFHPDWINIDFHKSGEGIIAHNLIDGIPLASESVEVVYHSHVLEHFSKSQAYIFLQECFRVLKEGGIIRIAVPDLEQIVKAYLQITEQLAQNPADASEQANHEWILLELFDQMVRNSPGGEMANYLRQAEIPNTEFVYARIGFEGKTMREQFLKDQQNQTTNAIVPSITKTHEQNSLFNSINNAVQYPWHALKFRLKHWLLKDELTSIRQQQAYAQIGMFRSQGEVHQWMYDQYSLGRLLKQVGFRDVKKTTAFESAIPDWKSYGLDTIGDEVRKPDSLFMEAIK